MAVQLDTGRWVIGRSQDVLYLHRLQIFPESARHAAKDVSRGELGPVCRRYFIHPGPGQGVLNHIAGGIGPVPLWSL